MKVSALFAGGLLLLTNAAWGSPPAQAFDIPHTKYTLENGLEVILHRDVSLPMVAVNLWYHVGPRNEPKGRSGFAHLFEHLMFEGSKHAGNQFDHLLESVGGTNMNGTTSWDRTNYYETVPAEHLELALWLEADRMGFMVDTLTQERLDVQRGVVENERRQSYENQPYGPSLLALYDTLFPVGHPYHGAIIGSIEDLARATLDDVRKFFHDYYTPGNATLVLAGNFDEATARRMVDKHFATLPARGSKVRLEGLQSGALPGPALPARVELSEIVHLPQVILAWLVPPAYSTDEPALELASRILGTGKASRLYQGLLIPGTANDVSATIDPNRLTSVVTVQARAASNVPIERLEGALWDELNRLAQDGPTPEELIRAKNSLALEVASQLQRLNAGGGESGRAGFLQRLNHHLGDPGALPRWMQAHRECTAAQVKAAVAKYLTAQRAVTVVTRVAAPDEGSNQEQVNP